MGVTAGFQIFPQLWKTNTVLYCIHSFIHFYSAYRLCEPHTDGTRYPHVFGLHVLAYYWSRQQALTSHWLKKLQILRLPFLVTDQTYAALNQETSSKPINSCDWVIILRVHNSDFTCY
jgi:hypothetical protein